MTWVLLSGLLIDALVGEPRFVWSRVPHPVVLVGKFIQLADERINKGVARKAKGIFFLCFLVASGGVLGRLIGELGAVVNATFVAILLAAIPCRSCKSSRCIPPSFTRRGPAGGRSNSGA